MPPAAQPEKLFSLFAQAVFSAPDCVGLGSTPPLPGTAGPEEPPQIAVPKLKALLVGFSPTELQLLYPLFRGLNFDTVTAADAHQALEVLTTQSIAILVVDWDLAATHSLILARTVRKMQIAQPVLIGLGTQLTASLKVSAKGTGFDQLYEKPPSHDLLMDYLRKKGFAVTVPLPAP